MTQSINNFCWFIINKGQTAGLKSGFQNWLWRCEQEALKSSIKKFYATICRKDGEDYKCDSFHIMVTAVDGYLTEKE